MLIPLFQMDLQPCFGILIIHIILNIKIDTAQQINELSQRHHINCNILVNGYLSSALTVCTVSGAPP